MAKDGLVHVWMGSGSYAPCGAKVATTDHREEIQQSCGDDLEKVTCGLCMALSSRFVKRYNRARRKHLLDHWEGRYPVRGGKKDG